MNRSRSSAGWRVVRIVVAVATLAVAAVACGAAPSETSAEGEAASTVKFSTATRMPSAAAEPPASGDRFTPEGTISGRFPGERVPVYMGGPIMTGTTYVRPIFYGTAWQPNYQSAVMSFLESLSATSYWNVVEGYTDGAGNHPGGLTITTPYYETDYKFGRTLGGGGVQNIVQNAVTQGDWPGGTDFIYLVFTADDVFDDEPDLEMCVDDIGWHYFASFTWTNLIPATFTLKLPFALVGSPQFCLNNPQLKGTSVDAGAGPKEWAHSWNGTVIDEAVSTAMHELAEAVTDPYPVLGEYGWAPEIGDICAWEPGPSTLTGGVYSDVGLGEPYASTQVGYGVNQGNPYLVQTIWDPVQNGCAYGPVAYDCKTYAAACGRMQCGSAPNGCGGSYRCGGCQSAQTCDTTTSTCTGGCPRGFVDCGDGSCAKKAIYCN